MNELIVNELTAIEEELRGMVAPSAQRRADELIARRDQIRGLRWEAVARNLATLIEDGPAAFIRIAAAHGVTPTGIARG